MVTSPFRRSVKNDTKKMGGKGKGRIYERFRLPVDVPAPFLFIAAEYVDPNPSQEEIVADPATGRPLDVKKPYYKVRKHKRQITINGRPRYPESVCSAGWNPHAPAPCAGCAAIDQGDKSVGLNDMAIFGIVHLAVYHKHPMIDRKTGGYAVKQNPQPGQQGSHGNLIMIDDECEGRTCNYCRTLQGQQLVVDPNAREPFPQYRPQDISTFFGKRRFMELGKKHLEHLGGWDAVVSSLCGNDGSQLITDGFKCPTCQTIAIDMSQDNRTDDQIRDVVSKPYPCMRCQRPVMLEEVIACEVCEQNQRPPRQFSLFDRILWGFRQGEQTNSTLILHRHESVAEFFGRVPAQYLGGKTVDQFLTDLAKPYDFAQVYTPKSIAEQLKELEFGQQGQGQGPMMSGGQMPPAQGGMIGYGQAPMQNLQPAPGPTPAGYGGPVPGGAVTPGFSQPGVQQPGPAAPAPMMRPHFGTGGNQ